MPTQCMHLEQPLRRCRRVHVAVPAKYDAVVVIRGILKIASALEAALGDLEASTMWLMANAMANPDNAGAGSVAYMHLTGVVAIGLMWLRMATAAQAA